MASGCLALSYPTESVWLLAAALGLHDASALPEPQPLAGAIEPLECAAELVEHGDRVLLRESVSRRRRKRCERRSHRVEHRQDASANGIDIGAADRVVVAQLDQVRDRETRAIRGE